MGLNRPGPWSWLEQPNPSPACCCGCRHLDRHNPARPTLRRAKVDSTVAPPLPKSEFGDPRPWIICRRLKILCFGFVLEENQQWW
ncbi:hypothetical protein NL676_023138 [Syzygium grande]|nr:hypothetical protein NL676_023138 [Syzygium grande]